MKLLEEILDSLPADPAVEDAEAGLAARLREIHRRIRQALAGG